jgi:hypothetical protein
MALRAGLTQTNPEGISRTRPPQAQDVQSELADLKETLSEQDGFGKIPSGARKLTPATIPFRGVRRKSK